MSFVQNIMTNSLRIFFKNRINPNFPNAIYNKGDILAYLGRT